LAVAVPPGGSGHGRGAIAQASAREKGQFTLRGPQADQPRDKCRAAVRRSRASLPPEG